MSGLVLRDVEVEGRGRVDVAIVRGRIVAIDRRLAKHPTEIDGLGGALLPGLWDHHIHLFALAAALQSIDASRIADAAALRRALDDRAMQRVVGYDDAIAGPLDRAALDHLVADRPLRVQYRTGSVWVLNGAALRLLGDAPLPPGAERDAGGSPTGRFFREDRWLRDRLRGVPPPLAPVARMLDGFGVTGVTDASVTTDQAGAIDLAIAVRSAGMRQRLTMMSGSALQRPARSRWRVGPRKIVLDDAQLPSPEALARDIAAARDEGRAVAVHCVTAAELALLLAAFTIQPARAGDRIEHGGVIPVEAIASLAALGLTVVTQPAFIAERGDRYRAQVARQDLPHLYRCASLIAAGVPVAGSSDAPYATADPWAAMRAAVARATGRGDMLGDSERLSPRRALGLWLTSPAAPGGGERRVAIGARADFVLMRRPLAEVLTDLSADHVRATIIGGRPCGSPL